MGEFIKVSSILEEVVDHTPSGLYRTLFFHCPGCDLLHPVHVQGPNRPVWQWDGNLEQPTFSPSLLVQYPWGPEQRPVVCHSFIRNGQIQFLSDCTHALAGQTVPIPPLPEDEDAF